MSILNMTVMDLLNHAHNAGGDDAVNKFVAKTKSGETILVLAMAMGTAAEPFESDLDDYLAQGGETTIGPNLDCSKGDGDDAK